MKKYFFNGAFGYDGLRRFVIGFDADGFITAWTETTDQAYADEIGETYRKSGEFSKVRVVCKAKANRLQKIDDELTRRATL